MELHHAAPGNVYVVRTPPAHARNGTTWKESRRSPNRRVDHHRARGRGHTGERLHRSLATEDVFSPSGSYVCMYTTHAAAAAPWAAASRCAPYKETPAAMSRVPAPLPRAGEEEEVRTISGEHGFPVAKMDGLVATKNCKCYCYVTSTRSPPLRAPGGRADDASTYSGPGSVLCAVSCLAPDADARPLPSRGRSSFSNAPAAVMGWCFVLFDISSVIDIWPPPHHVYYHASFSPPRF